MAFVSQSLTPSERNYPAHKLELLVLKWMDKLHDYLYGANFEVRTDNNPLTYRMLSVKLDAMGHCWLTALSTYNFSLRYRSGVQNIDADTLSHRPHPSPLKNTEWNDIPASGMRAMCQMSVVTKHRGPQSGSAVDLLGISPQAMSQAYCNLASLSVKNMPFVSLF